MFIKNVTKHKKKLFKFKSTACRLTLKSSIKLSNFKIKYLKKK